MNPWKDISHLSRPQLEDLQDQKLQTFIQEYLYPFSPHYKKIFDENQIDPKSIHSVADLARIPLTSKLDFINDKNSDKFKDFCLQPDKEKIKKHWPLSKKLPLLFSGKEKAQLDLQKEFRPCFMTFTTGTTNRPIPFLYSNYDLNNLRIYGARMLKLFGIPLEEKIVNIFPYAPHLAFWQVVQGGFESCNMVFSTGGGKVMGTSGNIAAIEKMKPTCIIGVPSYVYHLIRTAKEQRCRFPFVSKVVLGASKVTIGFKKKLIELLQSMGAQDVSVFGTYGFTEARCAWAECPTPVDESSGYFIYPDKGLFEVIDPETGDVKGEGEDGELVYTSLDARASVVLRYRTGDFVKGGIQYGKCPYTGMTVPRISSDITRLSDVKDLKLSKIKGTLVDMNHFAEVLADMQELDEWQVELRKKNDDPYDVDELVIYVCLAEKTDGRGMKEKIQNEILKATELSVNDVKFIELKEMVDRLGLEKENKEKRFLDCRPKD